MLVHVNSCGESGVSTAVETLKQVILLIVPVNGSDCIRQGIYILREADLASASVLCSQTAGLHSFALLLSSQRCQRCSSGSSKAAKMAARWQSIAASSAHMRALPEYGVNTGVSTPAELGVSTFQHLQKLVLTHPVSTVCQR